MTGVIEYQANQVSNASLVRDGVQGNYDVVWRMIDIVRETSILDKGFEDFVKYITIENGLDAYSEPEKIFEFWYNFVKNGDGDLFDGLAYIQDTNGSVESIKDARTTLQDGYGDCDDHAILLASILAVLGYSPCFVIAKYGDSKNFQHIYTVAYADSKRFVFDTTINDGKLNDEAESADKDEICVYEERSETDGIESVERNLKTLAKQTVNNIQKTIPMLTGFLPFGFLGNSMVKQMFSGIDKGIEQQSISQVGSQVSSEISDAIIQMQNGRLSQSTAYAIAKKRYSWLFEIDILTAEDQRAFEIIKKKIEQKLRYIQNFTPYQQGGGADFVQMDVTKYIVIGAFGLGIYYFYKNSKI